MKKHVHLSLLIAFCTVCFFSFTSFNSKDVINEITKALQKGDYKVVSDYFGQSVDLTIPGNEGTYSKSQAEMIIKDFFSKYVPKSFTLKNKGSSKSESQFVIGDLTTDKGVFRTYFVLKQTSGKYYIQQLKFEK